MRDQPVNMPQDHEDDDDEALKDDTAQQHKPDDQDTPDPPWTTTGKMTSPKFGSAGSGGAEYEPGPKRD